MFQACRLTKTKMQKKTLTDGSARKIVTSFIVCVKQETHSNRLPGLGRAADYSTARPRPQIADILGYSQSTISKELSLQLWPARLSCEAGPEKVFAKASEQSFQEPCNLRSIGSRDNRPFET